MARKCWALGPHLAMPMGMGFLSLLLPSNLQRASCTSQVRGGVVGWGSSVASHSVQFWLKDIRQNLREGCREPQTQQGGGLEGKVLAA